MYPGKTLIQKRLVKLSEISTAQLWIFQSNQGKCQIKCVQQQWQYIAQNGRIRMTKLWRGKGRKFFEHETQ